MTSQFGLPAGVVPRERGVGHPTRLHLPEAGREFGTAGSQCRPVNRRTFFDGHSEMGRDERAMGVIRGAPSQMKLVRLAAG